MSESGIERRRDRRLVTDAPIRLRTGTSECKGTLRNVSRGGAALWILGAPPPSVDAAVTFVVDGAQALSLPAEVIAVRRDDDTRQSRYAVHIKFADLDSDAIVQLGRFMYGLNPEDAAPPPETPRKSGILDPEEIDRFFASLRITSTRRPTQPDARGSGIMRAVLIATTALVVFTGFVLWRTRSERADLQRTAVTEPGFVLYRAQRGETLLTVADGTCIAGERAADTLLASNPELKSTDEPLETGFVVKIPRLSRYIVKSGDTLRGIAAALYGDPEYFEVIHEMNRDAVQDPDHPRAGLELMVPVAFR